MNLLQKDVAVGVRFGRLTVIGPAFRCGKAICRVVCQCECGTIFTKATNTFRQNAGQSCGCLNSELLRKRSLTHGFTKHPLMLVFWGMKKRCCKKTYREYRHYGGRGITICNEWLACPADFVRWGLSNGWQPGLEIDRIDNDGPYAPWNCRFVTPRVNCQNKRNNVWIEYGGERLVISEWARRIGIHPNTLSCRLRRHSVEDSLTMPPSEPTKQYAAFGETKSLKKWAADSRNPGTYDTLYRWVVDSGLSVEQAFAKPYRKNKTKFPAAFIEAHQ